ncbi:MAG TPA: hypothetical protein VJ952_05540 [Opitutales bacterium]|nr:hypothetical protein [Opitutales bacterium]
MKKTSKVANPVPGAILGALLSVLMLSGCQVLTAPLEADEPAVPPVNRTMIQADEVILDRVSVNGVRPPEKAWERCIQRLEKYVSGEIRVNPFIELSLPVNEEGYLTKNPEFSTKEQGLHHIALVFLPSSPKVNRGLYQRFRDDRQMIAYDQEGIESSAHFLLSKAKIWEIVLFHEIGHALGVPYQADRRWAKNHCRHAWCVMYPRVDYRSVLSVLFSGYPDDFCRDCRAEIEALLEGKTVEGNVETAKGVTLTVTTSVTGLKQESTTANES